MRLTMLILFLSITAQADVTTELSKAICESQTDNSQKYECTEFVASNDNLFSTTLLTCHKEPSEELKNQCYIKAAKVIGRVDPTTHVKSYFCAHSDLSLVEQNKCYLKVFQDRNIQYSKAKPGYGSQDSNQIVTSSAN
jgi:hypothetical protein